MKHKNTFETNLFFIGYRSKKIDWLQSIGDGILNFIVKKVLHFKKPLNKQII